MTPRPAPNRIPLSKAGPEDPRIQAVARILDAAAARWEREAAEAKPE